MEPKFNLKSLNPQTSQLETPILNQNQFMGSFNNPAPDNVTRFAEEKVLPPAGSLNPHFGQFQAEQTPDNYTQLPPTPVKKVNWLKILLIALGLFILSFGLTLVILVVLRTNILGGFN